MVGLKIFFLAGGLINCYWLFDKDDVLNELIFKKEAIVSNNCFHRRFMPSDQAEPHQSASSIVNTIPWKWEESLEP